MKNDSYQRFLRSEMYKEQQNSSKKKVSAGVEGWTGLCVHAILPVTNCLPAAAYLLHCLASSRWDASVVNLGLYFVREVILLLNEF
jgi:uncharacterized membrane protein